MLTVIVFIIAIPDKISGMVIFHFSAAVRTDEDDMLFSFFHSSVPFIVSSETKSRAEALLFVYWIFGLTWRTS